MPKKCPYCGTELPRNTMKYCPHCGAPLQETVQEDDPLEGRGLTVLLSIIIAFLVLLLCGLGVVFAKPEWFGRDTTPEPTADVTPAPDAAVTPTPSPDVTPTPEPTPTQAPQPEILGTFVPSISNLRRRSGPSTAAPVLSDQQYAVKGRSYDVYEISGPDSSGYTWYRIGDNAWVANSSDRSFGTYTPR